MTLISILSLGAAYAMNGQSIFYLEVISEPLFVFSLAILLISIFLFFINDKIFIKWLRFTLAWIILSVTLIILTPEYAGGWIPMNPDRGMVTIWMGSLFVILSLVKIIWDWKKEKNNPQA